MPTKRRLTAFAAIALAFAVAACAVTDEHNRTTLTVLDEHLIPASTSGRVALFPVALPVGLVAYAVDSLIHPFTVFDDAWGDTVELLWTSRNSSRFRRALMIPVSAILTPVIFVGDWIGRSLLPLPPRAGAAGESP